MTSKSFNREKYETKLKSDELHRKEIEINLMKIGRKMPLYLIREDIIKDLLQVLCKQIGFTPEIVVYEDDEIFEEEYKFLHIRIKVDRDCLDEYYKSVKAQYDDDVDFAEFSIQKRENKDYDYFDHMKSKEEK